MSNLSPDTSEFDIFANDDDSPDTGQMSSVSSVQGPTSPTGPSVSDFDRTMLDDTQPAGFHQQRQSAFDGQPTSPRNASAMRSTVIFMANVRR